jgi:hypothetical protein
MALTAIQKYFRILFFMIKNEIDRSLGSSAHRKSAASQRPANDFVKIFVKIILQPVAFIRWSSATVGFFIRWRNYFTAVFK